MLLGIGVDIVHLPRIAAIVKRQAGHKFARRILSSSELEQWDRLRDADVQQQIRFLAVRWAVKEAAYKALYPTVKSTWKHLSYRGHSSSGEKPTLSYLSSSDESAREVGPIYVSVSHDGDYAIAYVTVERKFPPLHLLPIDHFIGRFG
ncbi:Holo-[acyl-carrier-protein] synthase [Leucoagaricus sp. SymC.cos]|nr:Holo-[acyl-carrier-protein] synthase [Leucoagaricus sp. SymC.cos]